MRATASMTFTSGLLGALGIAGRSPDGAAGERPAVDYIAERRGSGGKSRWFAPLEMVERLPSRGRCVILWRASNPLRRSSMAVKITIRPNGPYLVEGDIE